MPRGTQTQIDWRAPGLLERARQLYVDDALSASQTAAALNRERGLAISRNALIGVAHRNHWPRKVPGGSKSGRPKKANGAKPKGRHPTFYRVKRSQAAQLAPMDHVKIAAEVPMPVKCEPVSLLNRSTTHDNNQCGWPMAEWKFRQSPGPDTPLCGAKAIWPAPYCEYHAFIAIHGVEAWKRKAEGISSSSSTGVSPNTEINGVPHEKPLGEEGRRDPERSQQTVT